MIDVGTSRLKYKSKAIFINHAYKHLVLNFGFQAQDAVENRIPLKFTVAHVVIGYTWVEHQGDHRRCDKHHQPCNSRHQCLPIYLSLFMFVASTQAFKRQLIHVVPKEPNLVFSDLI
ncbi:hypothetical protein CCR75_000468 [Bremia lactucae]|uniref:Uncharacterized protein n=1 Tax=Bremia lactucae TaxID=4779 RepID=A0A976IE60_BRELC|nr:hypothetical protein CCR75_000468 [Bremia lactucae]